MSTSPGGDRWMLGWLTGLLDCESRANDAALASIATVPTERRSLPAYDRAARLIPHNTLARRTWLDRITATPYENPAEWFPRTDENTLRADLAAADHAWREYFATLTDADLLREIEYTSSERKRYASRIGDIILHVHNHSTYHRGQLARLVKECGGTPAVTDLIALTRRPIDDGQAVGGVVSWR